MDSALIRLPKSTLVSIILIAASTIVFCVLLFADSLTQGVYSLFRHGRQEGGGGSSLEHQPSENHQRRFVFPFFELTSQFETGNLADAVSLSKYHYSLHIGTDPGNPIDHGKRHKNWFHFQAKSLHSTVKPIRFTIHGFEKNWSIWTHGCAFAYRSNLQTDGQWRVLNATDFKMLMKAKGLVMEFVYLFEPTEEVSFALTFPYSKQNLDAYLNATEAHFAQFRYFVFRRETLIKSNNGLPVDLLTLSDSTNLTSNLVPKMQHLFPNRSQNNRSSGTPLFHQNKRVYVLSARVHPSESASSFVLEGLLDRFKTMSTDVKEFFSRSVLYVIPMLNPDGVVSGFTRCDANGFNLNAKYKEADLHTPSIYALKKFIRYQNHRSKVRTFIDLHSHFTRRGFFMFGNPLQSKCYRSILQFPFLLKQFEPSFSVAGSKFGSKRKEESTSRKELYKYTKLRNIYTIEVNYWGGRSNKATLKSNRLIQNNLRKIVDFQSVYDIDQFKKFGKSIADALLSFDKQSEDGKEDTNILNSKIDKFYAKCQQKKMKRRAKSGKTVSKGAGKAGWAITSAPIAKPNDEEH